MQANETVGMVMAGIVVRPMNDRQPPGIVDHLASDLDPIAGADGAARRDADVVDDLELARAARNVECLVHRVGVRAVEEVRRRRDRPRKIDPGRRVPGVGGSKIHRRSITRGDTTG